ncbi:MAG TPA: hypothetical protein VG895_05510 [Patescibacteria group bacterium]|nr:hypothetical protein [Patescibacteria group bacterium]
MKEIGSQDISEVEILSDDKKRKFVITDNYGIQSISFSVLVDRKWFNMFTFIKDKDNSLYSIFVTTIPTEPIYSEEGFSYRSINGGKRTVINSRTTERKLRNHEEKMAKSGFKSYPDFPEEVDMIETFEQFVSQVKKREFKIPILTIKNPHQELVD